MAKRKQRLRQWFYRPLTAPTAMAVFGLMCWMMFIALLLLANCIGK
ncbi:MAG: hypothetical protein K6B45_10235 [Bacteroidaceae bacterium]|nr:hypothetical protein [Bacteroidaceae bacterium]